VDAGYYGVVRLHGICPLSVDEFHTSRTNSALSAEFVRGIRLLGPIPHKVRNSSEECGIRPSLEFAGVLYVESRHHRQLAPCRQKYLSFRKADGSDGIRIGVREH
jgi:hypothetical protein